MFAVNRLRSAALVLLAGLIASSARGQTSDDKLVYEAPSIRVFDKKTTLAADEPEQTIRSLILFGTRLGDQFQKPPNPNVTGVLAKDYTRLATTYYHRQGPLGQAMEQFNWFHGSDDFASADFRFPASLAGMRPSSMLCALWSEPPIAVVGMDVGTPAAYAHPGQIMHFYEANSRLAALTFPRLGQDPLFTFARDAYFRGAIVRHIPGPTQRAILAKNQCDGFYHLMVIELYKESVYTVQRDLLTQEAMAMCVSKLTPQGILCYHTSNRYFDLVPLLSTTAESLRLSWRRASDNPRDARNGQPAHFSSEWLFVCRDKKRLDDLESQSRGLSIIWSTPPADKRFLWKDGQSNFLNGLVRMDPQVGLLRYEVSKGLNVILRYCGFRQRSIIELDQAWQRACHRISAFVQLIRDY